MPVPEAAYEAAVARWQAQTVNLDRYNDQVKAVEQDIEERTRARSRRPSIRRAINHLSDGSRFSTQAADRRDDSLPSGPTHRKSWSHIRNRSFNSPPPAPEETGPSHYYQDPEARRQLKLVLSSPHKFDEALKFGFPTAAHDDDLDGYEDEGHQSHCRHSSKALNSRHRVSNSRNLPGRASSDAQRFMRNETLDFLDDPSSSDSAASSDNDDDDDDDDNDEDDQVSDGDDVEDDDEDDNVSVLEYSPVTPVNNSYNPRSLSQLNSPVLPAFPKRHSSRDWDNGWPPQREMTIRMTLTRPELRGVGEGGNVTPIYRTRDESLSYNKSRYDSTPSPALSNGSTLESTSQKSAILQPKEELRHRKQKESVDGGRMRNMLKRMSGRR